MVHGRLSGSPAYWRGFPSYLAFRPMWSADSPGYVIPYFLWRNHRFFLGARTPVYPLFLGLGQWLAMHPVRPALSDSATYQTIALQSALPVSAAYVIVCLQSVMDIAAVRLLYSHITEAERPQTYIALVFPLFIATVPALCLLDVNILTLSLSFTVLVCVRRCLPLMEKSCNGSVYRCVIAVRVGFACAALLRRRILSFALSSQPVSQELDAMKLRQARRATETGFRLLSSSSFCRQLP